MYTKISYTKEGMDFDLYIFPRSYIFAFITKRFDLKATHWLDDLPASDRWIVEKYAYVHSGTVGSEELFAFSDIPKEYLWPTEMPEPEGVRYKFEVVDVHTKPARYAELVAMLEDDGFVFKVQYNAAREYLERLKAERASTAGYFEGLL
jgi:hypothetical protein